jgi:hypothetical protein
LKSPSQPSNNQAQHPNQISKIFDIHNSTTWAETSKIKNQIIYIYLNFIVLLLWTTRDQFLSWYPLKESTGCLMEVATHTLTTGIPHILIWLHHMVPLKDLTKI